LICGGNNPVYGQLLQEVNKSLASVSANSRVTAAVVKGMNALLPSIGKQLSRLEGKQDQQALALSKIADLVEQVARTTDASKIEEKLAAKRGTWLSGTELSLCGCWGDLKGDPSTRANPQCLSEYETVVACVVPGTTNVCTPNFFRMFFYFEDKSYAPWQRRCQ
jgi:hypothetical protein